MTHGRLTVSKRGSKAKILLHTRHTGMDIPNMPREAIRLLARTEDFLLESYKDRVVSSQTIQDDFQTHGLHGFVSYPPTVAALLIAARPLFLEPMPPGFQTDILCRKFVQPD